MSRRNLAISLLLVAAGALACAGGEASQPVKLSGYLVDNMCLNAKGEGEGLMETARDHPTECSLMPGCAEDGFALVLDKKIYKLDEAGNKSTLAMLKTAKATKGLQVEVEGTLDGNSLRATKVSEVKAAEQ
jgi:hypothetical protein